MSKYSPKTPRYGENVNANSICKLCGKKLLVHSIMKGACPVQWKNFKQHYHPKDRFTPTA